MARDVSTDMSATLDNPVWHALTTKHRHASEGGDRARRYHADISVFGALADVDDASWRELAEVAGDGVVLVRADDVEPPAGWQTPFALPGRQMILSSPLPDLDVHGNQRPLTEADVPALLELVELTQPGPMRPRTIELGTFTGVFDGDRLIAMAGRRFSLPGYVEISSVCTHPDVQRQGYAAALTAHVAREIVAEGDTPILHVAITNDRARRVYEALGFVTRTELMFKLVTPPR